MASAYTERLVQWTLIWINTCHGSRAPDASTWGTSSDTAASRCLTLAVREMSDVSHRSGRNI
jgi:hypothetical protein